MYTATYQNNIYYYDEPVYIVTGIFDLCRGVYKYEFSIYPNKMFSQAKVNCDTFNLNSGYASIYLREEPTEDSI